MSSVGIPAGSPGPDQWAATQMPETMSDDAASPVVSALCGAEDARTSPRDAEKFARRTNVSQMQRHPQEESVRTQFERGGIAPVSKIVAISTTGWARGGQRACNRLSWRAARGVFPAPRWRADGSSAMRARDLTRFDDPFNLLSRFTRDMEQFFDAFGFANPIDGPKLAHAAEWMPSVDIVERDGFLTIHADLPGVTAKDVSVEVVNNALAIKGERRTDVEEKREGIYRQERTHG